MLMGAIFNGLMTIKVDGITDADGYTKHIG
jgi:hypothetical protein